MSDGLTRDERQELYRVAAEHGLDIRQGSDIGRAIVLLVRALDKVTKELRRIKMANPQTLEEFEKAIKDYLANDDTTAGEGRWYFRLEPNRTDAVGFPPRGTKRETLDKIIAEGLAGNGHIDELAVDPSGQHGKLKKQCIVLAIPYQPPGAQESRGDRPTLDEGERQPAPNPTGNPPPPPPPAQPPAETGIGPRGDAGESTDSGSLSKLEG